MNLSVDERNRLVERYGYIVHMTLPRLLPNMPATLEADDVLSEGMIGLIEAIEDFNEEKGTKLETYLIHKVRWRMLECVRRHSGVQSRQRKIQKTLAAAQAGAHSEGDNSNAAVARRMGIDTNAYLDMVKKAQNPTLWRDHQRAPAKGGFAEEEELTLELCLDLNENKPLEEALASERRDLLRRAMDQLTEIERRLVARHYEDGEYLRRAASQLGLTLSQARGRRRSALAKIRKFLEPYRACFTD